MATGRVHTFSASTTSIARPDGDVWWHVEVAVPRLLGRLSLAPESTLSRLGGALGNPDIRIGDPQFDARVRVRGIAPYARGALTAPVRKSVLAALDAGVAVKGDRLQWNFVDRPYARRALARCGRLATLAFQLDRSDDEVLVGLLQNAVWDGDAGVRARALHFLPVHAAGPRQWAILQAAVRGAGSEDDRERQASAKLLAALLVAKAALGESMGERQLALVLRHDRDRAGIEAARALGQRATASALEVVGEYVSGLLLPLELKAAAREAAESIRSRLGSSDGALSLAPELDRGDLSLVPKPGGALRFAD